MSKIDLFLTKYNETENILEKCELIQEFTNYGSEKLDIPAIVTLMSYFNDKNIHDSILRTILVISKPVMNHALIKDLRIELLKTIKEKNN